MLSGIERENFLKTVEMRGCEWIPIENFTFAPATWHKYREELEKLVLRHPIIFGQYQAGEQNFDYFAVNYRRGAFTDAWGCVWHNALDGLLGMVKESPLTDWNALPSYKPPDPVVYDDNGAPQDWKSVRVRVEEIKKRGRLTVGYLPYPSFFNRLAYLRGFENFMHDLIKGSSQFSTLIEMVLEHNIKLINRWMEIGVDVMSIDDDFGTRDKLMISPRSFRKHLLPGYERMFRIAREGGSHLHFRSDGHIVEILDDLIEAGANILEIQSFCNSLKDIRKICKGKVCIELYIDNGQVLPLGSPKDIRKHVREAVFELGSEEGGLIFSADVYPETPLENIEVLCQAFEDYRCYYTRK